MQIPNKYVAQTILQLLCSGLPFKWLCWYPWMVSDQMPVFLCPKCVSMSNAEFSECELLFEQETFILFCGICFSCFQLEALLCTDLINVLICVFKA